MTTNDLTDKLGAFRAKLDAVATRLDLPPWLVYAAAAFTGLLVLALMGGLLFGRASPPSYVAPAPTPAAHQEVQAAIKASTAPAAAPAAVAATPGALMQAELPALPPSATPLQFGKWQLTLQTTDGQTVGVLVKSAPTASFSGAVPDALTPFITMGKPVRMVYAFNFNIPTSGTYLLVANLAGNASAVTRMTIDGRAEALMTLQRNYNAVWANNNAPQVGSASVTLAAGLHSVAAVMDTTASAQAAQAATLDFYIKPANATLPAAMVPLWPASAPAAPASAPNKEGAAK